VQGGDIVNSIRSPRAIFLSLSASQKSEATFKFKKIESGKLLYCQNGFYCNSSVLGSCPPLIDITIIFFSAADEEFEFKPRAGCLGKSSNGRSL
jgi:hypothetical protein